MGRSKLKLVQPPRPSQMASALADKMFEGHRAARTLRWWVHSIEYRFPLLIIILLLAMLGLMVQSFLRDGRMRYAPGSSWELHDDRGDPSSDIK